MKFFTDIDFDLVGKIKNLLDPVDKQDAMTLNYFENNRFSVKRILSGQVLTIPVNHQMVVKGKLINKGKLILKGQLALVR